MNLETPEALIRALNKLGKRGEKEAVAAYRRAAIFGVAAIVQTSAKTVPRPRASGSYEASWRTVRLRSGAAISSKSPHSIFVEAGRRAGKMPPEKPILRWLRQKGIDRAKGRKQRTRRHRQRMKMIAFLIRRKIARDGIAGRYVVRRAMPDIADRARYELGAGIRKLTRNPPR